MSHKLKDFYTYYENKYFKGLEDYNKPQFDIKYDFFIDQIKNLNEEDYDVVDKNLRMFLELLSYNLYFDSKNYKYGIRYFNKDINDFTWKTTNERKCFEIKYFQRGYGEVEYEKKMKFSKKDLLKHFFSFSKINRLINFAYTSKDETLKENYRTALLNMYKANNCIYGSTQLLGTNVVLIDIDNTENQSALEALSIFLDDFDINIKELIYIEQNRFTGGIHTGFILPKCTYNEKFYKDFEEYVRKNSNIHFECNFINKVLRFPLSYEYNPIQKTDNIFLFKEFVPQSLMINNWKEFICQLNINKPIKSEKIIEFFSKYEELKYDYWEKHKRLFKKKLSKRIKPEYYKITRGNRYDTMSKLIPYAKMLGNSKEEVVDIILENNINSKDLNRWSRDKLLRNISSFYDRCPNDIIIKNKNYNGFISNQDLLHPITKDFIDNPIFSDYLTKRFIHFYMLERNKHNNGFNELSSLKIENLKKQIPEFIKEIIGTMIYQCNHKKEFINENYSYLDGFQLSDSHLIKIQAYINEKLDITNELKNTSIQYLKKALLNTLNLKEIKYNNRKKNWMNGCCKFYSIRKLADIIDMLNHLYNSCYHINYNYADKNNLKENILYILLVENKGIDNFEEYNLIKKINDIDNSP